MTEITPDCTYSIDVVLLVPVASVQIVFDCIANPFAQDIEGRVGFLDPPGVHSTLSLFRKRKENLCCILVGGASCVNSIKLDVKDNEELKVGVKWVNLWALFTMVGLL